MFINIQLKLFAWLQDAVVDYVQIKVAKDHYTLTMNLIIHTMKMYKTKKKKDKIKQKVFIDNKENMIHSLNKKKKKETNKTT